MTTPVVVLTVDQRGSRSSADRIPQMLAELASVPARVDFERTVGDEFQGVLDQGAAVADAVARLLRDDAWNIGVGVGTVEERPPGRSRPRSGSGPPCWRVGAAAAGRSPTSSPRDSRTPRSASGSASASRP